VQNAIKAEIKRLAARSFSKQKRLEYSEKEYRDKFERRTGIAAGLPPPATPIYKHKHFDPAYCARHANFLAKTIWHKVLTKTYQPIAAINYQIPKPDGSKRPIMAFSIPDAALANIVLRRTRDRNLKRLSPSSYAYHPGKNVFDAILALREFETDGKLFAVQIDFEKYFDNIPSWYLKRKINDAERISLTPHERYIFEKFLHHRYSPYETYHIGNHTRRIHGTPQGSSVSLILANLANHDLDTALSASSGRFVRFADDVVALCSDYSQAQELERCFVEHCRISGLKLNANKSPGIAVISNYNQEMRTYPHFDYLGYRFTVDGLTVPEKTIRKLKTRVSRLVNIYLSYYLKDGYNKARSSTTKPNYDWDLLGLIYELRNSLYGGLTENDLKDFITLGRRLKAMKGLMGFYCLIDDPTPLRNLDGWMLSIVRRAMVNRSAILHANYGHSCLTPTNAELATGKWLDPAAWKGGVLPDARMPSLVRGWRAARKHFFTFGLEQVEAPGYDVYADITKLF
jgi:retron-type reverse transcriptase